MRLVAIGCLSLAMCQMVYAWSSDEADPSLTVLLDVPDGRASPPLKTLQRELQDMFTGSHINVSLKLKSSIPDHAEFKDLVVFKLKGHCTLDNLPIDAVSDERGLLAMTYSVDGEILPFGEVECDRLQRTMQSAPHANGPFRQAAFNTALARVMAHEIYHMLASSNTHTRTGVTKEKLSARELSSGVLNFPPEVRRGLAAKESRSGR